MKIALSIKISQLDVLIQSIQYGREIQHPSTIAQKANNYLFETAFKKLLKKQIDNPKPNKKGCFKIALSYPEAAALWQGLQTVHLDDHYKKAVWVHFTSVLHQELISG